MLSTSYNGPPEIGPSERGIDMSARKLKTNLLYGLQLAITLGLVLQAQTAAALEPMDTSSSAPKYLKLSEFNKHVKGSLKWSVHRVGDTHEKRLVPSGLLNRACMNGAEMKMVKHPLQVRNEIIVVAKHVKC